MKPSKLICSFTSILISFSICGCSIFSPYNEKIVINTEPSGAKIIIDGEVTQSPATLEKRCDKTIDIRIMHDGYYPHTEIIRSTLGITGKLDVIGTVLFLLPCIGLCTPGAYTLDRHTIFVPLVPLNPANDDSKKTETTKANQFQNGPKDR